MGKRGKDLSVFTPAVVELIWVRDRGRCAWCGGVVPEYAERGAVWVIHHRQPRGSGGSHYLAHVGAASNGVLLHAHCHTADVERRRVDGIRYGFLVSRNGIRRPHEVEIKHAIHGWVRLTEEGGYEKCEPPKN